MGFVVWEISGHFGGVYQSRYCASDGAFLFSFVYVMNLKIASYFYGKQIKSKMGNELYLRIFICVRLIRLDLHDCHTMTLKGHYLFSKAYQVFPNYFYKISVLFSGHLECHWVCRFRLNM